jgi:segregation and condensation protein A
MSFSIEQEHYSGPLALLLELIDERKLEITQVSLAQVADAFLAHIEQADVPEDEMADFLVVAARLIYVKSRELLPYLQFKDEEEAADRLEDRLRAYKEFVEAAKRLEMRWGKNVLFVRPFARAKREEAFRPSQNVSTEGLHSAFHVVLKRLAPFFALREQKMTRTVSVEERVKALRSALAVRAKIQFQEIAGGAAERADVVVSFLALLEMLRRHEVTIMQEGSFGGILVEKI